MTTYTWTGSGAGDWADAGNWTPSGGSPSPTADAAVLTGGSTDYTVAISAGETFVVGAVTLADPFATLDVNGSLALAGGLINADSGTLELDQDGTISGGTIGLAGATIAFNGGTLSDVTWNGVLDLNANVATAYGLDDATLRIEDLPAWRQPASRTSLSSARKVRPVRSTLRETADGWICSTNRRSTM